MPDRGRFLRDNVFLVAAVALPILVVAFFIAATAIPRLTVPPPEYDLVLRVSRPYNGAPARIAVDFIVRDGQVVAVAEPVPPNTYRSSAALFLFEHESMRAREVAVPLPGMVTGGEKAEVVVDALAGRTVIEGATAPDGYQLQTRTNGGSGIVGELFGMGRHRHKAALVKGGRVVAIELPPPYQNSYASPASAVGWVTGDKAR